MAASCGKNDRLHKRRNPCTNRPLYRDGRREKAVKVFTINQESRYVLVQGVPDIKITDELLKLFSLYGTIEEYRMIDDLPSEEFTKNYWIKYGDIHAARIAKRKMDDHSFYGGFLHVTYAPEYESIQDTREKLQQRRKDVARRLRKLAQERAADVPEESIETITDLAPEAPLQIQSISSTPSIAWESATDEPTARDETVSGSTSSWFNTVSGDEPAHLLGQHSASPIPSLPAPPRRLPPWQWDIPSQPEFPRLRTAHETLPTGFDPFLSRDVHSQRHQGDSVNPLAQPPPPLPQLAPPGTFIGPQCPLTEANVSSNTDNTAQQEAWGSNELRTCHQPSGARPKMTMSGSDLGRQTLVHQGPSSAVGDPSRGVQHKDHPGRQGDDKKQEELGGDVSGQSSGGARPKLVGRRRLGPQAAGSGVQQGAGGQGDRSAPSGQARRPHFLPRVVSTRTKRTADSVEDVEDQEMTSLPVTGIASFDQTVSAIRQQMSQAPGNPRTGANPTSQLQSVILQTRNQERMGTLPRRPPVKRQRI